MWIEGELSNVATPGSGHWYFTLKDERAQIRCAFFRGKNIRCRVKPVHGQKVLVQGRVSLYEGRGDYQLIAEQMEDAGTGALQRAYEELKHRLQGEGLFDTLHKQALPKFPRHVGIVTSPTGAAIHDMVKVFKARCPMIPITIIPALVQGEEAPASIIKAIDQAENSKLFDVLIVGRGGGSLEDLWAFNNEALARRIAAAEIPIVSAVGHESDISISDLVADVRAATPSQAAELLSPDQEVWLRQLQQFNERLNNAAQRRLSYSQDRLNHLQARLRHPSSLLNEQAQKLDHYEHRLINAVSGTVTRRKQSLNNLERRVLAQNPQLSLAKQQEHLGHLKERLQRVISQQINQHTAQLSSSEKRLFNNTPQRTITKANESLNALESRLQNALVRMLQTQRLQLATSAAKLNTVSPLATLERGYTVTKTTDGNIVSSAKGVKAGDLLQVQWSDGEHQVKVEAKKRKKIKEEQLSLL